MIPERADHQLQIRTIPSSSVSNTSRLMLIAAAAYLTHGLQLNGGPSKFKEHRRFIIIFFVAYFDRFHLVRTKLE